MTSTSLSGLAPATISYPSNSTLIVYGSAGGTNIAINSTTSVTEFDGGAGNDTVTVESAPNTLNVNGAGGSDTVSIAPVGKETSTRFLDTITLTRQQCLYAEHQRSEQPELHIYPVCPHERDC